MKQRFEKQSGFPSSGVSARSFANRRLQPEPGRHTNAGRETDDRGASCKPCGEAYYGSSRCEPGSKATGRESGGKSGGKAGG